MTQNAKGPAEAATSPGHGSIIPEQDMKMNVQTNTTAAAEVPASKCPPDAEIVKALDNVLPDVQQLRRAAQVLDEYANNEFRKSNIQKMNGLFDYGLNRTQVEGITYMTDHVRSLSWALEQAFDKAFGLES